MDPTPADFYRTPWESRDQAPDLGQHYGGVLLEMGYDWDKTVALKDRGAIL